MRAGLVRGEGFAIDASVIEADASRSRKMDGRTTTWPEDEQVTRPVNEYLAALDQAMDCLHPRRRRSSAAAAVAMSAAINGQPI